MSKLQHEFNVECTWASVAVYRFDNLAISQIKKPDQKESLLGQLKHVHSEYKSNKIPTQALGTVSRGHYMSESTTHLFFYTTSSLSF